MAVGSQLVLAPKEILPTEHIARPAGWRLAESEDLTVPGLFVALGFVSLALPVFLDLIDFILRVVDYCLDLALDFIEFAHGILLLQIR